MRRIWTAALTACVGALAGCGGSGGKVEPVKLTPEQEAKQKAEQKAAEDEESGEAMNSQLKANKK